MRNPLIDLWFCKTRENELLKAPHLSKDSGKVRTRKGMDKGIFRINPLDFSEKPFKGLEKRRFLLSSRGYRLHAETLIRFTPTG